MTDTAWHVLLLVLGAAAFLAAVLVPDTHPLSAVRLRLVAAGLLLWILVAVLVAAGAL